MSLADEARALGNRHGNRCSTGALLDRLDESDRSEFLEALAEPEIQSTALTTALRRRGHSITYHSIQRHRRGACSCEETT